MLKNAEGANDLFEVMTFSSFFNKYSFTVTGAKHYTKKKYKIK